MKNKPWQWDYVPYNTESEYLHKVVTNGIRRGVWYQSPIQKYFLDTRETKRFTNKKTGKLCKHRKCDICEEWKPIKTGKKVSVKEKMYVDHIVPTRGFNKLEHAGRYIYDLVYCPIENLQLLCYDCHLIKTHADNKNISFHDAYIDKKVIAIMKKPVDTIKEILSEFGYEYQTPKEVNTEHIRKIILMTELDGY